MIYLITGVPGSGKSLYAVKLIREWIAENTEKERRGEEPRGIYVDIDGFDHDGMGTHPAPDDWRDTPDGSIVVYDECQQRFGPDGRGRSSNPCISALETHRHTGHDIVFITQRERLLHAHIRDLVGRHYHIQRQFGSHTVKVYRRDEAIDTKSTSALNQCDVSVWRYDKTLFDVYKSATVHTHKRALPNWLKFSIGGMVAASVFVVFMVFQAKNFFSGDTAQEVLASNDPSRDPRMDSDPLVVNVSKKPSPALIGCAVWAKRTRCECYDVHAVVVDMEFEQCIRTADGSIMQFVDQVIDSPSPTSKPRIGSASPVSM
jgi:hypothetical protein